METAAYYVAVKLSGTAPLFPIVPVIQHGRLFLARARLMDVGLISSSVRQKTMQPEAVLFSFVRFTAEE